MNNVNLTGRLVEDPKENQNSTSFRVAVRRDYAKEGQPDADFIRIVAFGKTGELVAKYKKKGSMIGITGRISTGSYEKQDGTKVYTTDVIADRVDFLGGKAQEKKADAPEGFTEYEDDDDDQIPF